MYYFNIHAIPLFVIAVMVFFLGVFVYKKNINSSSQKYFFGICISIAIWLLGTAMGYISKNPVEATIWFKIDNFGVMFVSPLFLGLVASETKTKINRMIFIGIAISLMFGILGVFFSYFISGIHEYFWGFFPKWRLLNSIPFFMFWGFYATKAFSLLNKAINSNISEIKKIQFKFLRISFFVIYLASFDYLATFGIEVYPFGFIPAVFFVSIIAYAIVHHKLMDIDLVWRKLAKEVIYYSFVGFYIGFIVHFLNIVTLKVTSQKIFAITAGLIFLLFHSKFKLWLNTLFLGKYNKIWHNLKQAGTIKSDMYDKLAVINILIFEIPEALNIQSASYYEISETSNDYKLTTTTNQQQDGDIKTILSSSELADELRSRKFFLYLDNLTNSSKLANEMKDLNINLCFPIFHQDDLIGILAYGKKQSSSIFHSEDLQILHNIIKEAEVQLDNIYKVQNISEDVLEQYKNTYQVKILNESKRLGAIREIRHFTKHSVKLLDRLLKATKTRMYILDEKKNLYFDPTNRKIKPIKASNYLVRILTENKEMIVKSTLDKLISNIKLKEFVEAAKTAEELDAEIIIPLTDLTHVLGFITISNKDEENQHFSKDDFLLLSFITDKIQTCLSNIFANKKANIDVLTGLHNRRFLKYRLESEIIKSYQTGTPISFIMADVDDFKFFNDAGGHDEGDFVLEKVSEMLLDLIRPTDECFRYAGDEFAIMFPNTPNEEAAKVAARIKKAYAEHKISKELNRIFGSPVTLSFGVSTFHPKKVSDEFHMKEIQAISATLIKRADEGLYESKANNKNCFYIGKPFSKVDYNIDLNSNIKDEEEIDKKEHILDHPFYYEEEHKTIRDFYKIYEDLKKKEDEE